MAKSTTLSPELVDYFCTSSILWGPLLAPFMELPISALTFASDFGPNIGRSARIFLLVQISDGVFAV